jgi:hypothetical protein
MASLVSSSFLCLFSSFWCGLFCTGLMGQGVASGGGRGTDLGPISLLVTERDYFRDQARELKVRLEALGADFSEASGSSLEQKLFRAVSDLRLARDEAALFKGALFQLAEAAGFYRSVSTVSNFDASGAIEGALRNASSALGAAPAGLGSVPPVSPSFMGAQVVSINEELSCAVINVGSSSGVVRGMPFRVMRDGSAVCDVRVHDVREGLSAALIEFTRDGRSVARAGDKVSFLAQ